MDEMSESRNKRLLKNILFIGIGTIFTKMVAFIMIPFYSNWLAPDEFGDYDLLASYVLLCVPFITLQMEQAIFRYTVDSKKTGLICYKKALKIMLMTSVAVAVAAVFVMHYTGYGKYIAAFILYITMLALYNAAAEYIRGSGDLIVYSLFNAVVGIITIISSIILVYYLKKGVNGMLLAFALGYCLSMLMIVIRFRLLNRIVKGGVETEIEIGEILGYSLPLIPNAVSWWVANASNRTFIRAILGSYYNGLFAVSSKIPTILSMFFSVFNMSFQEVAIHTLKSDDAREYYNDLMHQVLKILFTGGMVIVAATPIAYRFVNESYWDGIYSVPMLLGGAIFLSLAQYMGDIMLAQKNTKHVGVSTLVAAVMNVGLNVVFINIWGIVGAAVSTVVSYFLMLELRVIKLQGLIDSKKLHKKMVGYALLFVVVSVLTIHMAKNILAVVGITCLSMASFVLLNLDKIKGLLGMLLRKGKQR